MTWFCAWGIVELMECWLFCFHSLLSVSLILLGDRAQLSEQMWPVRLGGGAAVIDQIPSQGPGKVQRPHQGLPAPHQSPPLSLRESSPWALSRGRGDRPWPFPVSVPYQPQRMCFINRPLPRRPPEDLEGWR